MKCPKCGLLNPDSAQRCDCGYDFETLKVEESYLAADVPAEKTAEPTSRIRIVLIGVMSGTLVAVAVTLSNQAHYHTLLLVWAICNSWGIFYIKPMRRLALYGAVVLLTALPQMRFWKDYLAK